MAGHALWQDLMAIRRLSENRRDAAFGVAVSIFALLLFCWQISRPAQLYFDEMYYVPAARALLARTGGVNSEHPLFAKTLIAGGIWLFGDNALGWRLPGAFCAAGGIGAGYWLALQLFRRRAIALCTALLIVFDQTYFIQARIAMIDMPMMAMLLLGAACLLRGTAGRADDGRYRIAGAVAMGLAIGAKWVAAPFLLLFLALVGVARWRAAQHAPARDNPLQPDQIVSDTLKLAAISLAVYLLTFAPAFFYRQDAMTPPGLFAVQFRMLAAQSAPMAPHPYQSSWWQWPLMLRPIWYLFGKSAAAYQAVLLVGNPVIYWGGLLAVLTMASGWHKARTPALWLTTGVTVFSLLMWVVIPKPIGFFYYYNLTAVGLCFVITASFTALGPRGTRWLAWFTAASAAMFIYFYPIIAAQPLPTDDTWTTWVWMKSWY